LLRTNKVTRHDAAVLVNGFGAECHPRLTPSECRDAIKTGFARRMVQMRDKTIADRLSLTVAEAEMLEGMPPATRFGPQVPAPMASEIQARTIFERRTKITQIIADLGHIPTVREMGRRLIEAGFRGNHQTVQKDYQAMGVESKRTKAARDAERAKQFLLVEG
jgi:hypothetical protein